MDNTKLSISAIRRNLAGLSPVDQKKLSQGLMDVPVKKMFEQAQYLDSIMLPKIKEKRGEDSEDYKFYAGVLDTLLWAIHIHDRYEFLKTKYSNMAMLMEFFREKSIKYEAELMKYTTIEDLILSESMDQYKESIVKRAEALKKERSSKNS